MAIEGLAVHGKGMVRYMGFIDVYDASLLT